MGCTKASPLSQFVLKRFLLHQCLSSLAQSKHAKAHSYKGKKTAIEKCQRSGWPNKEEAGQNINHLWVKATTNGICLGAEQKSWLILSQIRSVMHTFLPERRPESVWNRPPFHHGPHTFHILSTDPEAPLYIMGMFLDCDGKLEELEKSSTCTGRSIRANGRLLWSYRTKLQRHVKLEWGTGWFRPKSWSEWK